MRLKLISELLREHAAGTLSDDDLLHAVEMGVVPPPPDGESLVKDPVEAPAAAALQGRGGMGGAGEGDDFEEIVEIPDSQASQECEIKQAERLVKGVGDGGAAAQEEKEESADRGDEEGQGDTMRDIQGLDCAFPSARRDGRFAASPFQKALLDHMTSVRQRRGHQTGLIVMATALGKTVLACLDIERQLDALPPAAPSPPPPPPKKTTLIECDQAVDEAKVENLKEVTSLPRATCAHALSRHDGDANAAALWLFQLQSVTSVQGGGGGGGGGSSGIGGKRKRSSHVRTPGAGGQFRFLFIVHTTAIRDTAHEKFRRHFLPAGFTTKSFVNVTDVFTGGALSRDSQFIFCLFQSFDRLSEATIQSITHVCIDECHHLRAETYAPIFAKLKASRSLRYCLGMTATLRHFKDPTGESIKRMFDGVTYVDLPWTQAKLLGFFPSVDYLEALPTLKRGNDLKTYAAILEHHQKRSSSVRPFVSELDRSIDSYRAIAPKEVVKTVLDYQRSRCEAGQAPKRRVLVFCSSINEADEVARLLNRTQADEGGSGLRYNGMAVHSKISTGQIERNLESFQKMPREGHVNVLSTVNQLNEGYDCPGVDLVVLARVTDSEIVFAQQMGRGLRKDIGDPLKEVTLLDLALNLRRRWKRLLVETTDADVFDMVKCFWPVTNFVGEF